MARKGEQRLRFEVKNATTTHTYPNPCRQTFRFLNELVLSDQTHKHAIVAAHLGKKWTFKEVPGQRGKKQAA
jgi:hypothetical protein